MIRYLRHTEIDKTKWDKCIANSINSRLFAYSWFLDIVSPKWDALVFNDYLAVMPLTWKRKFGLYYLIQPLFARQLGVFSTSVDDMTEVFLKNIPKKFIYVNICIKSFKSINPLKSKYKIHNNYLLPLQNNYDQIKKEYFKSHLKNIRRAVKNGVVIRHCSVAESIDFLKKEYSILFKNMNSVFFKIFERLIIKGNEFGTVKCYGAFRDDRLIANICSLSIGNHLYNMMIASNEGKSLLALFFLLDQFIKDNSMNDKFLDFGGSDIENIAYFFAGFGPIKEIYYQLKYSPLVPVFLL